MAFFKKSIFTKMKLSNTFYITIVLFILLTHKSLAQHSIQGKIFDAETKEAIAGATIQLLNQPNIGTITSSNGEFTLDSPEATPVLKVSMLGYQVQEIKAQSNPISISLLPNIEELQTIILTANREASLRTETPGCYF